jgi:hypothetical protein
MVGVGCWEGDSRKLEDRRRRDGFKLVDGGGMGLQPYGCIPLQSPEVLIGEMVRPGRVDRILRASYQLSSPLLHSIIIIHT